VAKKLNRRFKEDAFGRLSFQTILSESREHGVKSFQDLLWAVGKDDNVI